MLTFDEVTKHLIEDEKPSEFFEKAYKEGSFNKMPFNELVKLRKTEQELTHHPEGNVWNHVMLVVDNGAKIRNESKAPKVFMWSLLLHDIGKVKTTVKRKGRWTAYNHDTVGEKDGIEFLKSICNDKEFILKVSDYIRYHMHYLYISKKLPFGDMEGMRRRCDLDELKLVFRADRLGRGNLTEEEKDIIIEQIKDLKL